WRETSTTYMPAFDDARVTKVAASRTGETMLCQHCGHAHAPNIACATFRAQLLGGQPAPTPPPTPAPAPAPGPVTGTAEQFAAWVAAGQQVPPAPGPTVVDVRQSPTVT